MPPGPAGVDVETVPSTVVFVSIADVCVSGADCGFPAPSMRRKLRVNVRPLTVVVGHSKKPLVAEYRQVLGSRAEALRAGPILGEAIAAALLSADDDISVSSSATSGTLGEPGPLGLSEQPTRAAAAATNRIRLPALDGILPHISMRPM